MMFHKSSQGNKSIIIEKKNSTSVYFCFNGNKILRGLPWTKKLNESGMFTGIKKCRFG